MADPKAIFGDGDEDVDSPGAPEREPVCLKCGQAQRMMKCCTRCRAAFYWENSKATYRILHYPKPEVSKEIGAKPNTRTDQTTKTRSEDLPGFDITVRFNKQKHKLKICDCWTEDTIFEKMSEFLSVLPKTMKVICKGKQLSTDTVRSVFSPGAVVQVVGEPMENAEGLEVKDIEVLMAQMSVERNVAVRALRQSKGDLIDAMMAIGNK